MHAFCHYVYADGPFAFLNHDGRINIGAPTQTKERQINLSELAQEILELRKN